MSRPVVLRFLGDDSQLNAAFARVMRKAAETDSFLGKMGKFSAGMTRVGRSLTHGVTLPIVGIGLAAVRLATDYQAAMAKVQGLTNVSAKQMAAWDVAVRALAKTLPESPKDLAAGLYFIASAGLRGKFAIDALRVSAKAAAAGIGDMGSVADVVTSAMNAYGAKSVSAAMAGDVLIATVREGKMPASDLASSLGRVISPAQILGVKFYEVGAAIASMTHVGLSSYEATTALRGILLGLVKPSSTSAKEMQKLGLSVKGLREEIKDKGLLATLTTLAQKAKFDPTALSTLIPNKRALTGFLSMMKQTNDQTQQIFGRMAHSTGSLDKALNVVSQTAKFKFGVALNDLKLAGINLGLKLLPYFTKFADWLATIAGKFSSLSPKTQDFIIKTAALAAAIGPVIFILGKLGSGLTAIAKHPVIAVLTTLALLFLNAYMNNKKFREDVDKIVTSLGNFFQKVSKALPELEALTGAFLAFRGVLAIQALLGMVVGGIRALGTAMIVLRAIALNVRVAMILLDEAFLANPVGIVIAALVALGVALYILWNKSKTFRIGVMAAWVGVLDGAKMMGDVVMTVLGGILHGFDVFIQHVPGIPGSIKRAIKEADDTFSGWKKSMDGTLEGAITSTHLKMDALCVNLNAPVKKNIPIFMYLAEKYHTSLNAVLDAAGVDAKDKAKYIGAAMNQGLSEGIQAGQSLTMTMAEQFGLGVALAIRKGAKVHSPSKLTIYVGEMLSLGLAKGISNGTAGVSAAVDKQAKILLQKYRDALRKVSQAEAMLGTVEHSGSKKTGPSHVAVLHAEQAVTNAKIAATRAKQAYEASVGAWVATMKRRMAGKPLLGLAQQMAAGLTDAMGYGAGPIETVATTLADKLRKQFVDPQGKVPTAVAAAIANMKTLASKASSFRSDFINNMEGERSVVQGLNGKGPIGANDMETFLKSQLAKVKRFGSELKTLAKKGVPSDMLREIAQAGITNGLPIADALMNANASDFQQVLALQKQLNAASIQTANVAQNAVYGGGLAAAAARAGSSGQTNNVTINATTNADAKEIAKEVLWAIKTGAV